MSFCYLHHQFPRTRNSDTFLYSLFSEPKNPKTLKPKNMSGIILKNRSNVSHFIMLQRQSMFINHSCNPIRVHSFLSNKHHLKPHFRLPDFVKKPKQHEITPSLFSSSFCSSSSSSSSTASVSKVGFVGWYLGMIKSHPILTKSVTSALIYTAADLSSQTIEWQPSKSYDFIRTLRMAGYGMIILGPTLHFWFNFVSKLFPKRDLFSTLKKMVMGQTLYGPAMTVIFFSSNAGVQGENGKEIVARLKRDLLPTLLNGVMYWPICDFITFRFIPVHLQPLVSNSFAYLWTIYMTYMAGLEKAEITS